MHPGPAFSGGLRKCGGVDVLLAQKGSEGRMAVKDWAGPQAPCNKTGASGLQKGVGEFERSGTKPPVAAL